MPVLALLISVGTSACTTGAGSSTGPGTLVAEAPTARPAAPQPPDAAAGPPAAGVLGEAGLPDGAQGSVYTIEQATSDRAQQNTIAFDALGFLTGSLGADSFFPPGKVADFWGFQYLRDNDPSEMGHNTDFLTRASIDTLAVLTASQRQQLIALARSQVPAIQDYGYRRFVLMQAFRRLLEGDLPTGASGLDEAAVRDYSASLYELDGRISLERARVMGSILAGLSSDQRATLDAMVGKGMSTWPITGEPSDLAGLGRDEKEAVMTYAGDMFSWYAGSVEADTYFCPERHGTYFGSFYLKDAPAVGNPSYSIGTAVTGDLGATLLEKLDAKQAGIITSLVDAQRPSLLQIVDTRRAISTELREALAGGSPDGTAVANLMTTYGELDGAIAYAYATAFAEVGQSLTSAQRSELQVLRTELLGDLASPASAYLFSQQIPMPTIPSTDFLFS
jgi:hypothetical protein